MTLKSEQEVVTFLKEYEEKSRAFRVYLGYLVRASEGNLSWSEAWNMSREDRYNFEESLTNYAKDRAKAQDKVAKQG